MERQQREARALGDPTRHRLYGQLFDAGRPLRVAELCDLLGLTHQAVRAHLARLVEVGLVVESSASPSGRGRPPLLYEVEPTAAGRWRGTSPYERLAMLLTEVIETGDSPEEVGRRAGRSRPLGEVGTDSAAAVRRQMTQLGFEAELVRSGDTATVTLVTCPFASAVRVDEAVVCGLHRGLVEGIAESLGDLVLDELVIRDPTEAGCELRCRLTR